MAGVQASQNKRSIAALRRSHFISSSKTRASALIFNNPEKEDVMYLDKIKCANGYLSEAETLGSSPSRKVKSWQKKKRKELNRCTSQ